MIHRPKTYRFPERPSSLPQDRLRAPVGPPPSDLTPQLIIRSLRGDGALKLKQAGSWKHAALKHAGRERDAIRITPPP